VNCRVSVVKVVSQRSSRETEPVEHVTMLHHTGQRFQALISMAHQEVQQRYSAAQVRMLLAGAVLVRQCRPCRGRNTAPPDRMPVRLHAIVRATLQVNASAARQPCPEAPMRQASNRVCPGSW